MKTRYAPTDYLYASARIRALEASLVGDTKLAGLVSLKTEQELIAALQAEGLLPRENAPDTEAALLALLREGIDAVKRSVPDESLTYIVTYPYDCHNIKATLKCAYRGIDEKDLLIDAGSLSPSALKEALSGGDLAALPPHMAKAVPEAREAFAKTGDPREIDLILDRALFLDLEGAAQGLPFAERVIAARADLTNYIIALRLLRRSPLLSEALFARAFLPAGTLGEAFFREAIAEGEEALHAQMRRTPYASVADGAGEMSLSLLEKRADDLVMARVREAKYLPFGAEVPLAYLLALDASLKNVRILLAGKRAGSDTDTLRLRVRESYV